MAAVVFFSIQGTNPATPWGSMFGLHSLTARSLQKVQLYLIIILSVPSLD